jgi:cytochrome c oxidase assembly protein subunit 15
LDLLTKPSPGLSQAAIAAARSLRPTALTAAAVIGTTVASGAFVAGNDAGHAYNDWPWFAGRWIPEHIWEPALGSRNFFENTATVQFDHRMLAYSSIAAVAAVKVAASRAGWKVLPPPVRKWAIGLGALVALQATLGITTLMLYVPVSLGAAHQAGALALWTGALGLLHSIRQATAGAAVNVGAAAVKGAVAGVPRAAAAAAAVGCIAAVGRQQPHTSMKSPRGRQEREQ